MKAKVIENGKRINHKGIVSIDPAASRIAMIQMLIPLGLEAVKQTLLADVERLAGQKHSRGNEGQRWGKNAGSVYLGEQKVHMEVPRVRSKTSGKAMALSSYKALQDPKIIDEMVLARVMNGLSQRKYEVAALQVPETFGIKKSSVSRKFIRSTAKRLKTLLERDLRGVDIVAIFMDGKRFAEYGIIVALGITLEGQKIVLGFIESASENGEVCWDFLEGLKARGLRSDQEMLFIIDGSKGMKKAIEAVFGDQGIIQRCQWHKRENVVSYLPKRHQKSMRGKLQTAYGEATYAEAKASLLCIRKELSLLNESAVASLDEGFEETLTLHRLGVFQALGRSFKTTNCIESLNSRLEAYTHRVCYWKNSNQRQRWVASALLEIEPSLNRVRGYQHLEKLRIAMKRLTQERLDLACAA